MTVVKRNIGLITLPLHNYNYGGILQSYALSSFLKKAGHEVTVLDRHHATSGRVKAATFLFNMLNRGFLKAQAELTAPIRKFLSENLPMSPPLHSHEALERYVNRKPFDALITGSDQVWRAAYAHEMYADLFLNLNVSPAVKRFSYAASFGVDRWERPELRAEVANYLKKLDGVSVRESRGVEICRELGVDSAIQHVDPTLLLEKEDYLRLIAQSQEPLALFDKPTLVTYILDEDPLKHETASQIAAAKNLSIATVGKKPRLTPQNYRNFPVKAYDSIERWLHCFAHADFIVTDSFHGCIFSVIFNKPFIALGNKARGLSRFTSLLTTLGLQERLLTDDHTDFSRLLAEPIDYDLVGQRIQEQRIKSEQYINQMLAK